MTECICHRRGACEPHEHRQPNHGASFGCIVHGHYVVQLPVNDNPKCILDGGPTRRAGSCFVCVICGNSTSC